MLDAKVNLIFSGVFEWTSERVANLFDIFEGLPDEKKKRSFPLPKAGASTQLRPRENTLRNILTGALSTHSKSLVRMFP